jgi:hypothetical protein
MEGFIFFIMKFNRRKTHSTAFQKIWQTTVVLVLINRLTHAITKRKKNIRPHAQRQERSWRQQKTRLTYFDVHEINGDKVGVINVPASNNSFGRRPKNIKMFSIGLFALVLVSILTQSSLQKYSYWFRATLTNYDQVQFDGTSMPIKNVPNWSTLSEAERKMSYNQIPQSKIIPIPTYDPAAMKRGINWTPSNEKDRNTYITYPVAYAGNYKLDATENAGSHPGIDIKVPIGTPVHAYAAGVVTKVDFQSTGYGHHIVIKHSNVPDPKNPNLKTTLYSSYSHLSTTIAKNGQKVSKGQKIGLSGNTGMATAPHLHFQVDRSGAPFYPYWPFTWKEVQATPGVNSYFDAVNKKLGQSKLFTHSTHPIEYYNKYKNFAPTDTRVLAQAETPKPTTTVSVDDVRTSVIAQEIRSTPETRTAFSVTNTQPVTTTTPTVTSTRPVITPTTPKTQSSSLAVSGRLEIQTPKEFVPGKTHIVTFVADNPNLVASTGIDISSTLKSNATIKPDRLNTSDFKNGKALVSVTTNSSSTYKVIAMGNFGVMKSPTIKSQIFPDVPSNHPNQAAIKYVKDSGIFTGDGNGNFNPEGLLNRAAAVKVLLKANNITTKKPVGVSKFQDVGSAAWFREFVDEAASRGWVKGYGDGSFGPEKNMNRAEFLAVILKSKGITPKGLSGKPYLDVPEDSWFVDLFRFAKAHNLFSNSNNVQPGAFITRKEVAHIIYELRNVR